MRPGEPPCSRGLEPRILALLHEVNGEPVGPEQLADALDRSLERVRERELCDRLADDRQERPCALELDREGAAPLARAQRVRGANGEGCEPREHEIVGLALGLEEELERAERRLAELQGGECAAVAEPLDLDRPCLRLGALYGLQRNRGRGRARGAGEGRKHRPVGLVAPEQAGSDPVASHASAAT